MRVNVELPVSAPVIVTGLAGTWLGAIKAGATTMTATGSSTSGVVLFPGDVPAADSANWGDLDGSGSERDVAEESAWSAKLRGAACVVISVETWLARCGALAERVAVSGRATEVGDGAGWVRQAASAISARKPMAKKDCRGGRMAG